MKKLYLLALTAITGFSSCKLDWTCSCTYTNPAGSETSHLVITDTKRKDARNECSDLENMLKQRPTIYPSVSCDLKKKGIGF